MKYKKFLMYTFNRVSSSNFHLHQLMYLAFLVLIKQFPDIKYLISIFACMLAIEHGLEPSMLSFISNVCLKYAPK